MMQSKQLLLLLVVVVFIQGLNFTIYFNLSANLYKMLNSRDGRHIERI